MTTTLDQWIIECRKRLDEHATKAGVTARFEKGSWWAAYRADRQWPNLQTARNDLMNEEDHKSSPFWFMSHPPTMTTDDKQQTVSAWLPSKGVCSYWCVSRYGLGFCQTNFSDDFDPVQKPFLFLYRRKPAKDTFRLIQYLQRRVDGATVDVQIGYVGISGRQLFDKATGEYNYGEATDNEATSPMERLDPSAISSEQRMAETVHDLTRGIYGTVFSDQGVTVDLIREWLVPAKN